MKALFATAALVALTLGAVSANTPAEARARVAEIRATADAIVKECEAYGGGSWDAWFERSSQYRNNLQPWVAAAVERVGPYRKDPETVASPLLRADTAPPIYELPSYSNYLLYMSSKDIETWSKSQPAATAFVGVSKWLKAQNIDLILVPSPRMAEIYGDRLGSGAPAENIIAPHLRRLAYDLLQSDIEVVDLLPIFLKARAASAEPLYLPADGHWSDRAQQFAATEIARRLKRYDFVKASLSLKPRFVSVASHVAFRGSTFDMLTASQREEIKAAVAAMPITKVTTTAGAPFEESAQSPVLVIGDSFTNYFQTSIAKGSGIDALLSKAINIPVSNVSAAGATLDPIKEMIRRPELLKGRRVVVWIFNNASLTNGADDWQLPPMIK